MLPLTAVGALPALRRLSLQLLEMAPQQFDPAVLNLPLLIPFALLALLSAAAFFAWSWQGFSIAANLRGGRAVACYVVCYLLAEALAGWCTATIAAQ